MAVGDGGHGSEEAAGSADADVLGAKFKAYLFIECCVWLPGCYLVCYRYRPTVLFVSTPRGKALVERASALLQRHAPKQHRSLERLVGRMHGTPAVRAAAEWALVNKVLAPVNFPFKMWLGHRWVEWRRGGGDAAGGGPGP